MSIGFWFDTEKIEQEARREIEEEHFRMLVERRKAALREKTPWWHLLLPFTITITWRR